MGIFSNFAIKAGRKNFTLMVTTEIRLRLEAEQGQKLDISLFTPSIVAVSEMIFKEDLAPYISEHPSLYKARIPAAQERAVGAVVDALAIAFDAIQPEPPL